MIKKIELIIENGNTFLNDLNLNDNESIKNYLNDQIGGEEKLALMSSKLNVIEIENGVKYELEYLLDDDILYVE